MIKKIGVLIVCFLLPISCFSSPTDDINAVAATLNKMTSVWDQGDMNSFLNYYKNSDSTIYVTSTIITSYKNIAKHYESHYPNKDAMGKLSVSNLKIKLLPPSYAMTVGNWSLDRQGSSKVGGVFSLLWEKTQDGWKIVVDHTS